MYILIKIFFIQLLISHFVIGGPEEDQGVKYANKCEVCKVVATELEARLDETGKTHDILEIGYSLDDVLPKKKKEYKKSELRLVESIENLCERILEYNIHKERTDSTRFAKGMSQTFKALHDLVDKGVKVELGIPYELWDKPSVEISTLKSQCEDLIENHEADIEDWYHNHQGKIPLIRYLCSEKALKGEDDSCLKEKGETMSSDMKEKKIKKKENTKIQNKNKDIKEEL
ncbi:protein canopy 3 [Apis mellifera caucasica]|uniref:Protein canopy homolog 3 n=1 Tax=Apis mellifera TaxID=7460 RepID=A0A7M7SRN3_APIME|nr:protein canopy homolog 3 [Apis mellifera]KAG6797896.1 protein canopy 3 [Apis mellifera caucasica]KAG9429722.1 protein canopy 3 [Apis mellifera carnica]|eukprot:XP_026300889.1 protein canopy homolog 3 [Apis mellifera]